MALAFVMVLVKAWTLYRDRHGGHIKSMLAVAGSAQKQRNATWIIPIALILSAHFHAILVFHGDTLELARHAVQAVVQWIVGFYMLLLFAIDIIYGTGRAFYQRAVRARHD